MAALHTRPLHYLNGHFYHPETGERVLLRDGAELVFTGHKQDFLLTDRAGAPYETSELRDVETVWSSGSILNLLPHLLHNAS